MSVLPSLAVSRRLMRPFAAKPADIMAGIVRQGLDRANSSSLSQLAGQASLVF